MKTYTLAATSIILMAVLGANWVTVTVITIASIALLIKMTSGFASCPTGRLYASPVYRIKNSKN